MLRCEVSNLAGQVQWTKDGFALGLLVYIKQEKNNDLSLIKTIMIYSHYYPHIINNTKQAIA